MHNLTVNSNLKYLNNLAKNPVRSKFIQNWSDGIHNLDQNPITRTYSIFKHNFGMESYLDKISNFKYRRAITKLRVSSHDLMIEKGRHHTLKLDIEKRLCLTCGIVEDEIHFLVVCPLYSEKRAEFYDKINMDMNLIKNVNSDTIFYLLMNLRSKNHLEKLGEFIYSSFNKHRILAQS